MQASKNSLLAVLAALALGAAATAPLQSAQAELLGLTPDSEYLMFVVDTSGSMRRYEWDRVTATMRDILEMYPSVRGIQVINDEGEHLFLSYRGEWMPDTPANRDWIFEELENWNGSSSSNPRSGLLTAIDRYYDPDKTIALFVLGDDFSTGAAAIDVLVAEVDARNRERTDGVPRVRIHTVAFPVFYDILGPEQAIGSTGADFAKLMSMLSQRNDGRFLALPSRRSPAATADASAAQGSPGSGSRRVLIVVDTSANMREPYWRQAVDSVEWLLTETGEADFFQVVALTAAAPGVIAGAPGVIAGSSGQWLDGEDDALRDRVVAELRGITPAEAIVDLGGVPDVIRGFDPAPDEVYLLVASEPGFGRGNYPAIRTVLSGGVPVDMLLFGAGDHPQAMPYYWALALGGGGSLVAPAADWP